MKSNQLPNFTQFNKTKGLASLSLLAQPDGRSEQRREQHRARSPGASKQLLLCVVAASQPRCPCDVLLLASLPLSTEARPQHSNIAHNASASLTCAAQRRVERVGAKRRARRLARRLAAARRRNERLGGPERDERAVGGPVRLDGFG